MVYRSDNRTPDQIRPISIVPDFIRTADSGRKVHMYFCPTCGSTVYWKADGAPSWIGGLHRWSGRIAFILTVPVVVHCVYALGFQTFSARVLAHSIAGCLFFGVFTVKMLALTRRGMPGWVLPVLGGLAFALLVLLWFTSAFWFFTTF